MQILLRGKSSHAAVPEDGLSPAAAMAGLMVALPRLSHGTIGAADFALATLTHACLGAPTFGIAPADGELRVTLRTMTNARMDALIAQAQALVEDATDDLQVEVHWHDVFRAVVNDAEATAVVRDAALAGGHDIADLSRPMRWSEDFGLIGDDGARAALLYVGAGTDRPQLHNPDYDFPDALIPIVTDLLSGVVDRILGPAPA
jgi:metal-dependent amidase/aminoacylase/carboxypeptidase family protein